LRAERSNPDIVTVSSIVRCPRNIREIVQKPQSPSVSIAGLLRSARNDGLSIPLIAAAA
jgi:hypothetical protein